MASRWLSLIAACTALVATGLVTAPAALATTATVVQSAFRARVASGATATFSSATTAGDLLVVFLSDDDRGPTDAHVTDDDGGTYTEAVGVTIPSGSSQIWYRENASAVTRVTVRTTKSQVIIVRVDEISGAMPSLSLESANQASGYSIKLSSMGAVANSGDFVGAALAGHTSPERITATPTWSNDPFAEVADPAGGEVTTMQSGWEIGTSDKITYYFGEVSNAMGWTAAIAVFHHAAS
jgi:hypothetical protein